MPKTRSPEPSAPRPFAGFPPDALPFLADLAAHNERPWFEANRARYETAVKGPLGALVEALSFAFAVHEIPLSGTAKSSIFRIHRDTRFSKDKSPYKTNAGAVMNREGTKTSMGVLYVHLDPARCFTAAGFYMPEPDELARLRALMIADPERWHGVEAALAARGLALSTDDRLARAPKGVAPADAAAVGGAIRLRSFTVLRPIPPDTLASPDLVGWLVAFAEDAMPLLEFGWSALARRGE